MLAKAGCGNTERFQSVARDLAPQQRRWRHAALTSGWDLLVALLQSKLSLVCHCHLHSVYAKLKGKDSEDTRIAPPHPPTPPPFCSLCLVIREDDNLDADGGVGNGVGRVGVGVGVGGVNLHLEVTSQHKSRRAASLFTRIIILLLRGGASC